MTWLCAYCLANNRNAALRLRNRDGEEIGLGAAALAAEHMAGTEIRAYPGDRLPIDAITMVDGTAVCTLHVETAWDANRRR